MATEIVFQMYPEKVIGFSYKNKQHYDRCINAAFSVACILCQSEINKITTPVTFTCNVKYGVIQDNQTYKYIFNTVEDVAHFYTFCKCFSEQLDIYCDFMIHVPPIYATTEVTEYTVAKVDDHYTEHELKDFNNLLENACIEFMTKYGIPAPTHFRVFK